MGGAGLKKWRWIGLFILLISGLTCGCRSRKRSEKVGSEALKVVISLKNLEDVAKEKISDLSHRIQCEGGDWNPGTISSLEKLEVEFFVKGIQVGNKCSVQVIHPNPPAAYQFTEEPGVMYGTPQNIEVSSKVGGQLWAEALLSKYYSLKSTNQNGIVKVGVQFKDEIATNTAALVAELKCSPEFEVLALGVQKFDPKTKLGEFVFEGGLQEGVEYSCNRIQVRQNKNLSYFGAFSPKVIKLSNGLFEFDRVELHPVDVNNVEGVVIVTTPGTACKNNEIFDLESRTCKPIQ